MTTTMTLSHQEGTSLNARVKEILASASRKLSSPLNPKCLDVEEESESATHDEKVQHAQRRIGRSFASPITAYCQSLLSDVSLFEKEIHLESKKQKLQMDQHFFSMLKVVVEEEHELSMVKPLELQREDSTPPVGTQQDVAADNQATNQEYGIRNIEQLNFQLAEMQRQIEGVAQLVHEEQTAVQQETNTLKRTAQEKTSLDDIMEAIFGKVDYDEEKLQVKMNYIVKEIFETEGSYLRDLIRYKEFFSEALEASKLIDAAAHQAIFESLPAVVECNSLFAAEVMDAARVKEHVYEQSKVIAAGFCRWEEEFKRAYTPYIAKYDTSIATISRLKKNRKFLGFLDQVRDKLREMQCTITNINSFSIIPVQRVPRYRLLLNDLYKKTPKNLYELRADLNSALEAICRVADHCNEEARAGDLEKKASQLQNVLSVKYLTNRSYLMECTGLRWKKDRKSYTGTMHLFEDVIIFVSDRGALGLTGRSWKACYLNRDVLDIVDPSKTAPLQIVRRTNNIEVEFVAQKTKDKVYELAREAMKKKNTGLIEIQPVRWSLSNLLKRRSSSTHIGNISPR
mmetsp:Transcript_1389/g.4778  ORF Transcript_1389/g.4778 Transcript_1389/m.4778 type:complete len:570 (-) Transcript_1389:119-1828(-)